MKNRKFINEVTVNEVQLKDLYSAASKVEQQTISLADMAVSFSNANVKQQALALKSKANEFTSLLAQIMTQADFGEEKEENDLEVPADTGKEQIERNDQQARRVESKSYRTLGEARNAFLKKLNEIADFLEDNEEPENDGKENIMGVDLSEMFQDIMQKVEPTENDLNNYKEIVISELSNIEGSEEVVEEFEKVTDVDSFNFALKNLYDWAENEDITVKI